MAFKQMVQDSLFEIKYQYFYRKKDVHSALKIPMLGYLHFAPKTAIF